MKLIFTRHGETDWNVEKKIQGSTDIALNEKGIEQAYHLGETLQKEKYQIGKIYSSKLSRAQKTSEILSQILKVDFEPLDGLEEMNLGLWEGKTWKTVPELYGEKYEEWKKNRRYTKTPGGESYQDVLERVLQALKQILEKETANNKDIIIITHSAIIMTLQSYLHNTPFHEMAKRYNVKNTEMIIIEAEELKEKVKNAEK